MTKKETIAIVPGSFDPITNGHIFVINEAVKLYDKVFVAVMINASKQYTFTLEERQRISKAALRHMPRVEVIASDGWLYELANSLNADAIVKGYRNDVDLEYEKNMAEYNSKYAPNTKTVLIQTLNELSSVSSTLVRDKLKSKTDISDLLPKDAIDEINNILSQK